MSDKDNNTNSYVNGLTCWFICFYFSHLSKLLMYPFVMLNVSVLAEIFACLWIVVNLGVLVYVLIVFIRIAPGDDRVVRRENILMFVNIGQFFELLLTIVSHAIGMVYVHILTDLWIVGSVTFVIGLVFVSVILVNVAMCSSLTYILAKKMEKI